ncbi:sugar phosphate isomerase/epimerase [Alicyclobacillus contaminans]|uniref:sugar phosphate isomerase/epimerase family protein n=1 Tax=Alicyclobacillus contaminans TaxID=392016 RepID=UPI00041575D7|nr:sugar phosphate isomerase/epimerase [Alicyclobacillus contaminans]GMA51975.1 sugar phosphate isomerase/epimerase [Alicyclobacillus contaminans]
MKLGVFTVLFGDKTLEEMLDTVASAGLETVEIGTGGFPGNRFCDRTALLASEEKRTAFMDQVERRGLQISALSCHGNPLHPDKRVAKEAHETFRETVLLAEMLGISTVITFSGCPGESEDSRHSVWVTCPWPNEHSEVLRWQWEEKVIPYWKEQNAFLQEHGVRVAIEPHPGFVVYNTETVLRLRNACGERVGVNFDPSHLFWQGMDPVLCAQRLAEAGAIFHVHAKDTALHPYNVAENGVLDTKSYRDEPTRSWIFRTVGYGHGEEVWRNLISALQLGGYDGAISIEHEDSLMSTEEGLSKAVAFLKPLLIREKLKNVWWT